MEIDEFGMASVPAVRLDAAQLEQHIRDLAVLRRRMAPEVPRDYAGGATLDITDPDIESGTDPAQPDRVALFVRHSGLGWLCIEMPIEHAVTLGRDWLNLGSNRRALDAEPPTGGGGAAGGDANLLH